MRSYTWFLFDLDGTLLDFHRAEVLALQQATNEAGIDLTDKAASLYAKINDALWAEFEHGAITARDIRNARFVQWLDALEVDQDPTALSERFLELLVEHSTYIEGAEALLHALLGNVQMALITNGFADVQRGRVARFGLDRWFDPILISEELGASKPNREIFDIAFERMGHPEKAEVLILGDSMSSDIRGGVNYGIDTCWFNPASHTNDTGLIPTYEIRHLHEIRSLASAGRSRDE